MKQVEKQKRNNALNKQKLQQALFRMRRNGDDLRADIVEKHWQIIQRAFNAEGYAGIDKAFDLTSNVRSADLETFLKQLKQYVGDDYMKT